MDYLRAGQPQVGLMLLRQSAEAASATRDKETLRRLIELTVPDRAWRRIPPSYAAEIVRIAECGLREAARRSSGRRGSRSQARPETALKAQEASAPEEAATPVLVPESPAEPVALEQASAPEEAAAPVLLTEPPAEPVALEQVSAPEEAAAPALLTEPPEEAVALEQASAPEEAAAPVLVPEPAEAGPQGRRLGQRRKGDDRRASRHGSIVDRIGRSSERRSGVERRTCSERRHA